MAHGAFNRALMISLNHQGIKDYWEGVSKRTVALIYMKLTEIILNLSRMVKYIMRTKAERITENNESNSRDKKKHAS